MFLVGLYGGIVQAGVGFLFLISLSLLENLSLVEINSIKLLIVLVYTIPVLVVFIANTKVDLLYGLVLAAGNSIGGWAGVHWSVKKGDRLVKLIFAVAVILMALKLLEVF
jgi:uncharacterized membrane protein YfcA